MKKINEKHQTLFQCKKCKLYYKDIEWAQKCEEWCREHHSCNLEIIKHAKTNNK